MATITYKPSNTATFGSSGSAVSALQTQLNTQNAGVAGYVPLKVDGKYGPLTQAASQFKAPTVTPPAYNTTTGATTDYGRSIGAKEMLGGNPVISSKTYGAEVKSTDKEIKDMYDSSGLQSSYDSLNTILDDRMKQMKSDYDADVAGIKTSYEEADRLQTQRQGKDYAGRATGLVTSGGGFLGTTQSQQGVLQSLNETFTQEKNALMSKRDTALREARNAYNDKSFAVALQKLKEAKDTEKELYSRQKDFADQKLALSREDRAQKEFDLGYTDKKIEQYAMMSDADFAKITPEQLAETDRNAYSGYTAAKRAITKQAQTVKTSKEAIALDSDILDMRLKMPQGQKFVLGGQTYTGLKKPEGGGKMTDSETFNSTLNYFRQSIFVPGTTIVGSQGVPFLEKAALDQGKYWATSEGWREALRISGMKRADFINEFKQYLNPEALSAYGLDGGEIKKITGI